MRVEGCGAMWRVVVLSVMLGLKKSASQYCKGRQASLGATPLGLMGMGGGGGASS